MCTLSLDFIVWNGVFPATLSENSCCFWPMSTSSRGDMGRRSVSIKRLATMRNSLFMNTSARQFLGRCGSRREQKDKFINSPSMFDLRAQPTGPSDYYVLRWIEKAQNFIVIRDRK